MSKAIKTADIVEVLKIAKKQPFRVNATSRSICPRQRKIANALTRHGYLQHHRQQKCDVYYLTQSGRLYLQRNRA